MTGTSLPDLFGFGAVIALLLWTGSRRARREQEFLLADRSLGLFPLVATLVMTEFNTSTLLAFSAAGFSVGPIALGLPLVFLVGLSFYTLTVARAWKRFNRLSVAELFTARYSPALGRVASLLLLLAMTGFSATYVKSLTLIAGPLAPDVPFALLSAVATVIVLALVLPGGLVSVVRSDIAAFLITLVIAPVLLWSAVQASAPLGGLAAAFPPDQLVLDPVRQWQHPAMPFRFVTTLIVLTSFTYIAAPWYGQKIFAARNERTAFLAVACAALLVFVLYAILLLASAHFRVVSGALPDPQAAVPAMMAALLPPVLRGVAFAMLFAAAFTTLSGVWTAMAAMLAADFAGEPARRMGAQRAIVIGFALASWLGAVFLVDDILNRLILANVPVAALAFALLAGFHWPRATTAGAWASITVGFLWGAGCFIVVGERGGYTWPWAMYGVPLIFATGIVVSLCTAADRGARA
jgi:Na+/proline symporter